MADWVEAICNLAALQQGTDHCAAELQGQACASAVAWLLVGAALCTIWARIVCSAAAHAQQPMQGTGLQASHRRPQAWVLASWQQKTMIRQLRMLARPADAVGQVLWAGGWHAAGCAETGLEIHLQE